MQPSCENTVILQDLLYGPLEKAVNSEEFKERCKNVRICDEIGICVTIPSYSRTLQKDQNTPIFHSKRVLYTLTYALEGKDKLTEVKKALQKQCKKDDFSFVQFISKNYGDNSLLVATIKCMSKVFG